MWAFGCSIAAIVFHKYPFFRAHGNANQLLSITDVLGSQGLHEYVKQYNLTIPDEVSKKLGVRRKCHWSEFENRSNSQFINNQLYDLLDHLLIYDHQVLYSPHDKNELLHL